MTYVKSIKTQLDILLITLLHNVILKPWLPILYIFIITINYALFCTLIDDFSSPLYCMNNSIEEERLARETAAWAETQRIAEQAQRSAEQAAAETQRIAEQAQRVADEARAQSQRYMEEAAVAAENQRIAEYQGQISEIQRAVHEGLRLANSQVTPDGHHWVHRSSDGSINSIECSNGGYVDNPDPVNDPNWTNPNTNNPLHSLNGEHNHSR